MLDKFEVSDKQQIKILEDRLYDKEQEIVRLKRKVAKLEKQLGKTPEEIALEQKRERRKELIHEYWWIVLPFSCILMVITAYILRVICGFEWWNM